MSQVEPPGHVRLYGPAFALHDVRDVEAHVRTLLDSTLREWGAHLDSAKYNDALSYLVALCWRLSGLQADGRTPRVEYSVQILLSADGEHWSQKLGPFPSQVRAEAAYATWARELEVRVPTVHVATYVEHAPAGAYDPNVGLSFSTYSRRILSRRVVDWYRATFGDNRYGGNPKPVSLDQLLDDRESLDGAGGGLDHQEPGARAEYVDELNRHAYYDPFEERDTRSVTDQGGPDRVAAAR